jgi:hypothetical protein
MRCEAADTRPRDTDEADIPAGEGQASEEGELKVVAQVLPWYACQMEAGPVSDAWEAWSMSEGTRRVGGEGRDTEGVNSTRKVGKHASVPSLGQPS